MSRIDSFTKFAEKWANVFNWVAMFFIAGLLVLTVSDVIGSKLKMPIPAGYYLTGFVLLLVCAFGVAQAEVKGRHIRIDILLVRLSERARGRFGIFSNIVSAAIVAAVIITSIQYGFYLIDFGLVTMDLEIPLFPFAFIIAIGVIPLFFVLVSEVFDSIRKARTK